MIKNIFNRFFINGFLIFLGFLAGRFTANKLSHKTEVKESLNQQINTTQVSTIVQNKVDLSQDVNTSYTEKFFNKRGILVYEIEKTHENRASNLSFTKHTDLSIVNLKATSATSSTIETSYQSSWTVGFFVPFKTHLDFQELNAQVQYRLLGPIHLAAQTDYRFTKPMVGFLINF